jgi:hypothetical protein
MDTRSRESRLAVGLRANWWFRVAVCAVGLASIAAAQDGGMQAWQGASPSGVDARDFSKFEWGANTAGEGFFDPLEAHGEAYSPWYRLPPFRHGDHENRSTGFGDPLVGTSWRNRPFHVGWLFGGMIGDDLAEGIAEQHQDIVGGYRLGWDFDHYWGTEARFAFSNVDFTDAFDVSNRRNAENHYWDLNLLYYPWGDSRWRPFASLGIGAAIFEYRLADDTMVDNTLMTFPIAFGMKYYFKNWMALRLTATDNLAIGQGPLDTMHNVTWTADVEMHFGGRRTSYFPHSGSIHMW